VLVIFVVTELYSSSLIFAHEGIHVLVQRPSTTAGRSSYEYHVYIRVEKGVEILSPPLPQTPPPRKVRKTIERKKRSRI